LFMAYDLYNTIQPGHAGIFCCDEWIKGNVTQSMICWWIYFTGQQWCRWGNVLPINIIYKSYCRYVYVFVTTCEWFWYSDR